MCVSVHVFASLRMSDKRASSHALLRVRLSSLFVSLQPGVLSSCHNYMLLWKRRHVCSRRHFKSEIFLRSLQRRKSSHKASAHFPPDRPAALPWCHMMCGVTTGCSDTCAEIIQRAGHCVQPITTRQKQGFPRLSVDMQYIVKGI